ncbi:MAG: acyl-CoA dehydrogenase [Candidatus Rokubacteria bacterium RIFCSPLOWO2_12_FULL_71_22]|nr:MAG: acyl-CoA dehydrogenase [Candidatus Rokubacteria bacterium RIFCSPLOWO2_12_FULL_71_22]
MFRADLRAIRFTLYDHLQVQQLFDLDAYAHLSREECDAVIDQCLRFVTEVTGPLNAPGDRAGCRIENGRVVTPAGFREAWRKLFEFGFMSFTMPVKAGGFGGPRAIGVVLSELQSGANTAFNMYPGLTHGAADLLEAFGSPQDHARFLTPMIEGRFAGTMCLTEPHAGSDVGATKTRARHLGGDVYAISGTKCFISSGDHDLTENIVHLVLARIEGAPAGTKGLSLFIVPKIWVEEDGRPGEPNDVATASIEHKLGIRASATAVLAFGENGRCRGILVGGRPHEGMRQMFRMMNVARIAVGVQGIAVASTAYLNALAYARERLQGSSVRHFKDPDAPRVPIIEHADVRRMLLEMKAKVEGMRTLAIKLALHADLAQALAATDEGRAAYHEGQVDLLTPIVKAYCSDQAFRVAELAIQVYGGAGYVEDHPVEQYLRDAKIFSIYEGTNHIQALDLVSRKLQSRGGENLAAFLRQLGEFVERHRVHPALGVEVAALGEAVGALQRAGGALLELFTGGRVDEVTLIANPFLEIMAEVTIAHLLLDAALVAESRRAEADEDFARGKVLAAKFYANFVLPGVHAKLAAIVGGDRSALDIPDGGFSTVR